jgi:RNA polymerase sigma-70 factor (ECF subfamily)
MRGPSSLAFDDVVRATRSLARAIAFRVLRDDADADDAVQDAFVRAFTSLESLRDPRALPAWIARIAHRAAVDRLRARSRQLRGFTDCEEGGARGGVRESERERKRENLDFADDDAPSPEDLAIAERERERIEVALRSLPREMQRVIELRALGMSGPEIARALGIALGTVESRLHRARQRIVSDCFDGKRAGRRGGGSG